jgi:hypothetical protein
MDRVESAPRSPEQVEDESERNAKRDELLDAQLKEARASAAAVRRGQAEGVKVSLRPDGNIIAVRNDEQRPITDITCQLVRKSTGEIVSGSVGSGTMTRMGRAGGWNPPILSGEVRALTHWGLGSRQFLDSAADPNSGPTFSSLGLLTTLSSGGNLMNFST